MPRQNIFNEAKNKNYAVKKRTEHNKPNRPGRPDVAPASPAGFHRHASRLSPACATGKVHP